MRPVHSTIGQPPAQELVLQAAQLPTPSLVYDLDGLRSTVAIIREDLSNLPGAQLNLALKACHTPAVLHELNRQGLGADVASMAEFRLASEIGFAPITATGPSFTASDIAELDSASVILDVNSVEQLRDVGPHLAGGAVGLRVRVDLPQALRIGRATFGSNSRFGVDPLDRALHTEIERHSLRVTRLHTHTGQMTPRHFLYKLTYLLKLSEFFSSVAEIDMGGGFFHLYASRDSARQALEEASRLLSAHADRTGRALTLQFEPGGALLAPHGFLVATVTASEFHRGLDANLITLDASAWNFAPWHKPQLVPLTAARADEVPTKTYVAGNTLYENDFFGVDTHGTIPAYQLPELEAREKVMLTASGAYTMTNSRRFHMLEPPAEYVYVDGSLCRLP